MAWPAHTVPWRRWCELEAFAQVLGYFRTGGRDPELLMLPSYTFGSSAGC
jgi:hypothetical protein